MPKKTIFSIYSEHTPNPNVLKFVSNISLFNSTKEFFEKPNTIHFPLISMLFNFPFVMKVFLGKNFISIEKSNSLEWLEISSEIRIFIQKKLNDGVKISTIDLEKKIKGGTTKAEKKIESIIEKEIRPYIQMDGGEIKLISFKNGIVEVSLQGACRGCPSSISTLKNGIENKLKAEMPNEVIEVISL